MKKLLGLLFVLLMFVGCGEDKGMIFGYHVNNVKDLDFNSVKECSIGDSTWLVGLKNRKIWIGLFDKQTKDQLNEWTCNKELPNSIETILSLDVLKFDNYSICQIYLPMSGYSSASKILILESNHNVVETDIINGYSLHSAWDNNILLKKESGGILYSLDGTIAVEGVGVAVMGDSTLLSGFRNRKIWFGLYDSNHKQLNEWSTVDEFDRNVKIHNGYDNYTEYYLESIQGVRHILKTNWGFAVTSDMRFLIQNRLPGVFFLNDGRVFYYLDSSFEAMDSPMRLWYNESILVDGKTIFTPEGKLIAEFKEYAFGEPVSYKEEVRYQTCELVRINLETGEIIWNTSIDRLDKVQSDARIAMTVIDKKDKIWTYRCDILNKDGSKVQFNLQINIETGALAYL